MIEYKPLLQEALALAKSNGIKKKDIVLKSGVSNATITNWLNDKQEPTILKLGNVINACGKKLRLTMI